MYNLADVNGETEGGVPMRTSIVSWLGREFVALACEGQPGRTATEEARDIFERMDHELQGLGLTLANTVRTRLWGRDRASRDEGSTERVRILSGPARSASSSYIAPDFFASDARVGVELLALRPSRAGTPKVAKEYEPPIVPVRYCTYDGLVFLSGVTAVLPTLADQIADILPRITESLADAGASWERVERVSCYLHRSQPLAELKRLFAQRVDAQIPQMEYAFVDGYSTEGKLIEIETTARL
jgi:enamine deaminase RidA (YjgF/YER057c/UK114 family)